MIHYTDVQAVHSILSNQIIWLTDSRFLNDKTELEQGINLFRQNLVYLKANHCFTKKNDIKAIEFIESMMFDSDEDSIYIFSLSKAHDRLSQWRSYGSYGIEFNEEILKEYGTILHHCFYNERDKIAIVTKYLLDSIKKISAEMEKYEYISELCIDEIINLKKLAAIFKDEAFFEEEEIRIIISDVEKIKYRTKNDKLIPYIELPLQYNCIKSIHVGPMNDQNLAYASMSDFVRQIEKNLQNEYGDIEFEIKVEKSDIPYRS